MTEIMITGTTTLEQDIEIIKNQLLHITDILTQTEKHEQLKDFDKDSFSYYNYGIGYLKECKNTWVMRFELFKLLKDKKLDFQCVKYLIDCYNSEEMKQSYWEEQFNLGECTLTPVHIICKYGNFQIIKYVLDNIKLGIDIEREISHNNNKYNLMQILCIERKYFREDTDKILCCMLDIYDSHNLNFECKTHDKHAQSLIALIGGNYYLSTDTFKYALDIWNRRGLFSEMVYIDGNKNTLLHILCDGNKWKEIRYVYDILVERNIDFANTNKYILGVIFSRAPYELIIHVLEVMIDKKIVLEGVICTHGLTILQCACLNCRLDTNEFMNILNTWIDNGLNVEIPSENIQEKKLIHYIIERFGKDHLVMKKILDIWINKGFDLDCTMKDGVKPIHSICSYGCIETIKYTFNAYANNNLDFSCGTKYGSNTLCCLSSHITKNNLFSNVLNVFARKYGYLRTMCIVINQGIGIKHLFGLFWDGFFRTLGLQSNRTIS